MIKDFIVGTRITATLGVLESSIAKAANGPYLKMTMTDGKDKIVGKIWQYRNSEYPKAGDVVDFMARVSEYRGVKDLNITDLRLSSEPFEKFRKQGLTVQEAQTALQGVLEKVQKEEYRNFLLDIFKYIEHKEGEYLFICPAAKSIHHDHTGGLIQHMCEVAEYAIGLNYMNKCDNDFLIVAALLHDIGKISTYKYEKLAIEHTDEGKLYEHILLGTMLIQRIYTKHFLFFDRYAELIHCIVSHHGKLEYGSPVVPKTPEAFILHLADMASSKLEVIYTTLDSTEGRWSEKVWSLGTDLYKGDIPTNTVDKENDKNEEGTNDSSIDGVSE